jgi:nucleotide-binding universal stress UspA family protein
MAGLFHKVLIATDGSKYSQGAAREGLEIARLHGAKVFALYVIDTRALNMATGMPVPGNLYTVLQEEGMHAVGRVKQMAAGTEVETFVLPGLPASEIVDFAEDNGVDLIVMGSLGKSGIEALLLGSVASRVIRHAPCPVLVVKSTS